MTAGLCRFADFVCYVVRSQDAGAMDPVTLGIVVALLAVILAGLMYAKQQSSEESKPRRRNVPQPGQPVPEGPRGRRAGPRMRRTAAAANTEPEPAPFDDGEGGEDGGEDVDAPSAKMGKKKLEKLQAKADKKLAREAMEREREEKKKQKEQEVCDIAGHFSPF